MHKKLNILLFCLVTIISSISVFAWTDNSSLFQYIDGCGDLTTNGAYYEMNASIDTTAVGHCISITSQVNIIFNMSNYSIYKHPARASSYAGILISYGGNITLTSSWDWDYASRGISNDAGRILATQNNGYSDTQRAIRIEYANNILIDHVYGTLSGDPGHYTSNNEGLLTQDSNNITVSNREWVNNFWRQQVWILGGTGHLIENLTWKHAAGSTGEFIQAYGNANNFGVTINNITCLDNLGTTVIKLPSSTNHTIISNSVLNSSSYSITMGRTVYNTTIVNNTILGGISMSLVNSITPFILNNTIMDNNITTYNTGIYMKGATGGNIIKDNIITSLGNNAIEIDSLSNTIFTKNNIFENNTLSSPITDIKNSTRTELIGNGYATSPSTLNLGKNYTIAFTAKDISNTGLSYLFSNSSQTFLYFNNNGVLEFRIANQGSSFTCGVSGQGVAGTNRIVLTKLDTDLYPIVYKNGVAVTASNWNSLANVAFVMPIKINNSFGIDELIILNQSVNQAWILADYQGGAIKHYESSEPNLVHGWHFDEATGTNAENFINKDYNLTFAGNYSWQVGLGINLYNLYMERTRPTIGGDNNTILRNQNVGPYFINGIGVTLNVENQYGIINFTQVVNGTGNNLSNDVRLEQNFASVNDSSGMNRTAVITLYNLNQGISNLEAQYLCNDNAANNIINDELNNYDATSTANTNTLSTSGLLNNALNIPVGASIDASVLNSIFSGTNSWSISMWFKTVDGTHHSSLMGLDNFGIYGYWNKDTKKINFGTTGGELQTTLLQSGGVWHHVVFIRDSSVWKVSIDGILSSSTITSATSLNMVGRTFTLGYAGGVQAQTTTLDDIRIYSKALSQNEISLIYNGSYGSESKFNDLFLNPKVFRNNVNICDDLTTPICTYLNDLNNNAMFSVSSWSNYTVKENYGAIFASPANDYVLVRNTSALLNFTINGGTGTLWNVTVFNTTDPNNNITITTFTNIPHTTELTYLLINLTPGQRFNWTVFMTNQTNNYSTTFGFFPNDEPKVRNIHAVINSSEVLFSWENEMSMEWVSLYLGNEWLELRSITSLFDSWSLTNVYPGREYMFRWQTGDNLKAMSDMYNFSIRSFGWNPDMIDYNYKRIITIDKDAVIIDKENGAINISLDENNFQWCTGSQWWDSCYPAFTHFNYTTLNDIRFMDYYDVDEIPYEVTYVNIPHEGGQRIQVTPDEGFVDGTINDFDKMYDGDWNTYSVAAPSGTFYFNYTLDAGVKTNSMFRSYDGEWFWDGQLPTDCYGGSKLRFKKMMDYDAPYVRTYCQNNSDDSWILVFDAVSAHAYETMMTFQYEAQLQITVKPNHFNDELQRMSSGIDGDYNTSLLMYYGYAAATNGESSLTYDSLMQGNYIIGSEEVHILGVPVISNINDTEARTTTGTNVSWDVDQEVDNRIKLATNPWLLDSYYFSSTKQITQTFEHQYGNIANKLKLTVYGTDYLNVVSVVCSNASYSASYTINSSTGDLPVELNIPNLGVDEYVDWNITYSENKTWDRNTQRPVFEVEGLATDTTYYYQVEAYGSRGNATSSIYSFTLGTPIDTPDAIILNYTEDRPNKQVYVCGEITDMLGADNVAVSFQYFNQTDNTFKETTPETKSTLGEFCQYVPTLFGENNTYRIKITTIPVSTCQGDPYYGTPTDCSWLFYDSGSCSSYMNWNSQCGWSPYLYCEGDMSSYCYYSDAYNCQQGYTNGCAWSQNLYCTGDQYSYCAYNFYDPGSCNAASGCGWYDSGGNCYDVDWNYITWANTYEECTGTYGGVNYDGSRYCSPTIDCSVQDYYAGCGGYGGCSQADGSYCYQTTECNYQDSSTCSNYGACSLYDYGGCYGSLTCAGQIDSNACGGIGCTWIAGSAPVTGYSESYSNLFDNKYEFFIGNPVEDDMMYLDRQYCLPNLDGTVNEDGPCYEELGYREGSQQQENWAYFETNLSTAYKIEKLKLINGTQKDGTLSHRSIANYTLNTGVEGIKYYYLTGLDTNFYTFKVYDSSNNLVLDWVHPSLTHKKLHTRIDENAYISFSGTPAPIDYRIMYFKYPGTYNTSSYQWCQAQPNGNLYDCMSVQYWGTGMDKSLTGTSYDRGQFFRGGITNGEPRDSGLLQFTRNQDSIASLFGDAEEPFTSGIDSERFCFAFTVYYFDESMIPTNNITNYYARYWRENQHWSDYLGIYQDSTIDQWNLFEWDIDDISMTRDWKEVSGTTIYEPSIVKTAAGTYFNNEFQQSLIVGYQEGFNFDVSNDKIYKSGIYFDGQWINQQFGKYQQGYVIFNLPNNATLQGLDTDGDTLNDYDELYVYYSNPFSSNTDEDDLVDGLESINGYDINLPDIFMPQITVNFPIGHLFTTDYDGSIILSIDKSISNCVLNDTRWDLSAINDDADMFTFINNTPLDAVIYGPLNNPTINGEYHIKASCTDNTGIVGTLDFNFLLEEFIETYYPTTGWGGGYGGMGGQTNESYPINETIKEEIKVPVEKNNSLLLVMLILLTGYYIYRQRRRKFVK